MAPSAETFHLTHSRSPSPSRRRENIQTVLSSVTKPTEQDRLSQVQQNQVHIRLRRAEQLISYWFTSIQVSFRVYPELFLMLKHLLFLSSSNFLQFFSWCFIKNWFKPKTCCRKFYTSEVNGCVPFPSAGWRPGYNWWQAEVVNQIQSLHSALGRQTVCVIGHGSAGLASGIEWSIRLMSRWCKLRPPSLPLCKLDY